MLHHSHPVETLNIAEPLRRPESLQRPGRSNSRRREGRETPETRISINSPQAYRCRSTCDGCSLGNDEIDHDRAAGSHRSEHTEEFTPADPSERKLGWQCR